MILTDKDFNDGLISHLADIERVCFTDPWSENNIRSAGQSAGALIAISDKDNSGYLLARCAADECELYRIAVLPEYRRKGCGSRLIDELKAECLSRGITKIFLEVRSDNLSAIRLYESKGFILLAVRKGYYTSPSGDALIYKLGLDGQ